MNHERWEPSALLAGILPLLSQSLVLTQSEDLNESQLPCSLVKGAWRVLAVKGQFQWAEEPLAPSQQPARSSLERRSKGVLKMSLA